MRTKRVLIVVPNYLGAELYRLAFVAGKYETIMCTDLDDVINLVVTNQPHVIFWPHHPSHTKDEIQSLEKIHDLYPSNNTDRPFIIIAVNEYFYPQIAVLADMVIEKGPILDLPGFLADIDRLIEAKNRVLPDSSG